jgi:hypothetical protein
VEKFGRHRRATDDNIIWHIGFACEITKATDTHSVYMVLFASPWQQRLHEHASMLCYMYIACFFFHTRAYVNCTVMVFNYMLQKLLVLDWQVWKCK